MSVSLVHMAKDKAGPCHCRCDKLHHPHFYIQYILVFVAFVWLYEMEQLRQIKWDERLDTAFVHRGTCSANWATKVPHSTILLRKNYFWDIVFIAAVSYHSWCEKTFIHVQQHLYLLPVSNMLDVNQGKTPGEWLGSSRIWSYRIRHWLGLYPDK